MLIYLKKGGNEMVSFRDKKKFQLRTSKRVTVPRPAQLRSNQKTKFSQVRKRATKTQLQSKLRAWAESQKPPEVKDKSVRVRSRLVNAKDMNAFRSIRTNKAPLAEALQNQKMDIPTLVGLQWSFIATHEYALVRTAYKNSLRKARTARVSLTKRTALIKEIDKGWKKVVAEYGRAFAVTGVRNVTEQKLDGAVNAMTSSRKAHSEFLSMYDSVQGRPLSLAGRPSWITGIVHATRDVIQYKDWNVIHVDPDWCGFDPITGVHTEHFSKGFELTTTVDYPCGVKWCSKYGIPYACGINWCSKTITLISGSVSFSVDIGYELDCCGASSWGSAEVEACGTILGATLCAGCSAAVGTVTGVGEITVEGSECSYGLGIVLSVHCYLADYTVLSASYPIGWVITGPCPPEGIC